MTDERKKFLASISKEEKLIRFALDEARYLLKMAKCEIKFYDRGLGKIVAHHRINALIKIVKALKKQLPAPRKERTICRARLYNCFVCGSSLCNPYDNYGENYCFRCGQKLR